MDEDAADAVTLKAELRVKEAMAKVELAQKHAEQFDQQLTDAGEPEIRRGSVLAAIKDIEHRNKKQSLMDHRSVAIEQVNTQMEELEVAREAFKRARETRQRFVDDQIAAEAKSVEDAKRFQDELRVRRANNSLAVILERDAQKRAEFDSAAKVAEVKFRELEEKQARRRKEQMLALAEQVQERQAMEAEERRINKLMEEAAADPGKRKMLQRMQENLQQRTINEERAKREQSAADLAADAEIAAKVKELQDAQQLLADVQRRILESQSSTDDIVARPSSPTLDDVVRQREEAEVVARRESDRVAQLTQELQEAERARLDFEKETAESAAARARRREDMDKEKKRMQSLQSEAQRAAEERFRAAIEAQHRAQEAAEAEARQQREEEERLARLDRVRLKSY